MIKSHDMKNRELVIGLEVHLKLNSTHKLFCSCINTQDFVTTQPNTHICPTCTGQPGGLPVIQQTAVEKALLLGRLLNCEIVNPSSFDRKSYFYPDLPSGYQITQFNTPYAQRGQVSFFSEDFSSESSVNITEAHMETDTAKTIHDGSVALLDFNRAGTPLVEIVTEPDFRNAEQVSSFLKELQRMVKFNNIGDADMDKGQMRVDVNISIRPEGASEYGTRVEIKNMSSFSMIKKAINTEYDRLVILYESGETFDQETRRWDETTDTTILMRSKENALEYRYFPEPDLPLCLIPTEIIDSINEITTISPHDTIKRYRDEYDFNKEYIHLLMSTPATHAYAQRLFATDISPRIIGQWLVGPIASYCKEQRIECDELPVSFAYLVNFLHEIEKKTITYDQGKIVLKKMLESDLSPASIIKELGFDAAGLSDDDIRAIGTDVLAAHPHIVEQYRGGKESAI